MLPGSELKVNEGASMTIPDGSHLAVYDGLTDTTGNISNSAVYLPLAGYADYDHTETNVNIWDPYPSAEQLKSGNFNSNGSANLIVDGSLIINGGFGGVVQTNGTGSINTAGMTQTSETVQISGVGHCSVDFAFISLKDYYLTGASVRTLDAEIFDTTTGTRTPM